MPEINAERITAVVSLPRTEATNPSAPISSSPKSTSPPLASDDPPLPFAGLPGLAGASGPFGQSRASASGSGFADDVPPIGPTEAGEGSDRASLSGFSATDICSYLVNNDVYIGDGLQEVKDLSCNRKMEFIFNCHSLVGFFCILGHLFIHTCFLTCVVLFSDDE